MFAYIPESTGIALTSEEASSFIVVDLPAKYDMLLKTAKQKRTALWTKFMEDNSLQECHKQNAADRAIEGKNNRVRIVNGATTVA